MTTYRSLVGGFFSATPYDKTTGHVSIRMNNPGAVNGAAWEREYPGYVAEVETTPGNRSTIFEAPEYGIAVWWELMRRYRTAGATTLGQIVNRYGGGQDYSAYVKAVSLRTGFDPNHEIDLYNNDADLLKFAKAMFTQEAGGTLPWSDKQILYGFKFGRGRAHGVPPPDPQPPVPRRKFIEILVEAFLNLFRRKPK